MQLLCRGPQGGRDPRRPPWTFRICLSSICHYQLIQSAAATSQPEDAQGSLFPVPPQLSLRVLCKSAQSLSALHPVLLPVLYPTGLVFQVFFKHSTHIQMKQTCFSQATSGHLHASVPCFRANCRERQEALVTPQKVSAKLSGCLSF